MNKYINDIVSGIVVKMIIKKNYQISYKKFQYRLWKKIISISK